MLVLESSSTCSQHINHSGQDSVKFSFELHYFGPDLRLAQTKTAIPIRSVQNADCRPRSKCRLGKKCRLQTEYKMQTENLDCFFVWYVITTCYLTLTERHAIAFAHHLLQLFALLWNIPRPFLNHRRSYFRPDVCTEFTNLIKVDVDVNEMSLSHI